ncbi:MAG: hypothetical protein JWN85_1637 [Gammaproteobacteria bacterium]|jgi:hypothetical protein|nr:hypothetical protein [Gammaproteobacteria bacterium]
MTLVREGWEDVLPALGKLQNFRYPQGAHRVARRSALRFRHAISGYGSGAGALTAAAELMGTVQQFVYCHFRKVSP